MTIAEEKDGGEFEEVEADGKIDLGSMSVG
jgi:hypothetical protein